MLYLAPNFRSLLLMIEILLTELGGVRVRAINLKITSNTLLVPLDSVL